MTKRLRFVATLIVFTCGAQLGGCDWFIDADKRIARAEQHVAAGDDRGALIELQNAVRSEPDNVRAHLMLADISLRLGDPRSAEKELAQAIAHGAPAEQAAELQAKARLALGQLRPLIEQLDSRQIALSEPSRSTYRGLALLGLNELEPASKAFREALASDPKWAPARVGLAEALAAQRQSDAGLAELATVLDADSNNASAWLVRGRILAQQGQFKPAVAALDAAREHAAGQLSGAQYSAVLAGLTEAQLASGDVEAAQKTHAELLKRAPGSPFTGLLAARIAMVRQDYTTAVAESQKVVTAVPELTAAKFLLGAALLAQGNLNQAEVQLSQVVRQTPENMEARKLLARVNLQLQRPDMAMQVLLPAQQSQAADPDLDALLGWANLQRGDNPAAIALLERSVAAQPANTGLKLDLAMTYISSGLNDKAVALLRSTPATPGDTRRDSLLVAALAAEKGPAAARAEIERLTAASPDDIGVLNLAGVFYGRTGEFDRARTMLNHAAALKPKDAASLMNLARVETAAGNQKAATAAIERALAADPANSSARLALAEIALRGGDLAAAIKPLEELRAADATAAAPRVLLAGVYLQQKKAREADAILAELQVQAQDKPSVANAVGRLYLDAGRFDEALNWFRDASQKEPANASYQLNIARTQLALGNTSSARETLEKTVAAHPDSVPANATLVMLDLRENRRDAAVARVAEMKRLHPKDASVAMLDGDVAMTLRSYPAAAKAYATAAKLSPSGALALRTYRARKLGGLPDPIAPIESWLQRQPQDVAVRMALAEEFVARGDAGRAIDQYERAIQGERPNAMALNNLAWLYHEKGDARAMETAKRGYTAAPQVAAIADTYGWILVKAGKVSEGLPILKKAVTDSRSQPDIRFHYAAALAEAGQKEAALGELRELERSGAKYPSAVDAQKLLAELGT